MKPDFNYLNRRIRQPHFMLVPSLSCPASCRYCFGPNTGPSMNSPIIQRTIDFMEAIVRDTKTGKVRVTLHGGEPLAAGFEVVEALISSLYERFNRYGLNLGIQSNLWLLDDRYCELFAGYKVEISTSLDGPQHLNDSQRGPGSFAKTMQGIGRARAHGLNVGCIATFTALSMPHWQEIFDFFMAENLHFSVHPSVSPLAGHTELELTPEQYWQLFREMFDYYIKNRRNIKISSFDQICQGVAANDGRVCTFRNCFGMFLAIDPLGEIYSCQRFAGKPQFSLGNVSSLPSINDLYNTEAARELLEREKQVKEKCGACEHYQICRGGCTYNALSRNDRPDCTDPLCEAYQKIFAYTRQRMLVEMTADDNLKAIEGLGPAEDGNPLLRRGPVIELTREHTHPYYSARTAKRIVAAYELARCSNMQETARRLAEMGISRTEPSARAALDSLANNMSPAGQLNKLYIHVTWNCQLHCSHCYACAGGQASREEMKADSIEKLIVEASQCGFKEVVITGGEPLLLRERDIILLKLAGLRPKIHPQQLILRTNFALPLTEEDCRLLAAAFNNIVVSVDGGKKEHDHRRGKGTYDLVINNLELYLDLINNTRDSGASLQKNAELSIAASMSARKVNDDPGMAVRDLAKKLGIRYKFRPLLPLGRALDLEEPIVSEALRSYLTPMEVMEQGFNPMATCGIGQNLYVEPSGESFPCYAYHRPESFLGNVIREGLPNIIAGPSFKSLQSRTVDTNHKCRTCDYRYLCGGACRAWGRGTSRPDLDAAPTDCEGLRTRAEQLYQAARAYLGYEPELPN